MRKNGEDTRGVYDTLSITAAAVCPYVPLSMVSSIETSAYPCVRRCAAAGGNAQGRALYFPFD